MAHLCGSATPGGCNRSCATRWSDQPNRMARARATAPCAGTTRQMKTPPASEDANGVFHAFTSRKVAALEMKTSKQRLRSGWIRIFCGSACASRPECRPGLAQRRRIIFMALPFEFLLRFPETRHALSTAIASQEHATTILQRRFPIHAPFAPANRVGTRIKRTRIRQDRDGR